MNSKEDLETALTALTVFLTSPLTATVGELEQKLEGREQQDLQDLVDDFGISQDLLAAACLIRSRLGRINDVIHAVAICVSLPRLLQPNEQLSRPSLASGNDKSRPFDVVTDLRVAEFKLARWHGADAMRKRQVFKDLVHLAAEDSDREKELYVLGPEPGRFLKSSTAAAGWALDRFPATRQRFESAFGSLDISISDFTSGGGSAVHVIDLEERLPDLFPSDMSYEPRSH